MGFNMKWVECSKSLPELGDYSVLLYFSNSGSVEMGHVEDFFKDMTAGVDADGNQLYTKWYMSCGITHWSHMLAPPE